MGVGTASKVELIIDAYSQLRISGLTVIPTPNELELALMRLENMAAEWKRRNVCANYNFEEQPDPNTDSWVEREFWHAFASNLALRLVPDFNKMPSPVLVAQANQSLNMISGATAISRLNQVPYPSRQPLGSGNTLRYYRWWRFYQQSNQAPNSCRTNVLSQGEVNDYFEDYAAYLKEDDNEVIATFDVIVTPGLELVSSALVGDNRVDYRIKALGGTTTSGTQQVTVAIKTDLARVETRFIFFDIKPDETNITDGL